MWIGFDQPQTIMGGGYAAEVAVPLWAAFMRDATKGDPAEWYKAPAGVVTANICRISGKRPSEGCYGAVRTRRRRVACTSTSTVYTEYFVKGTVPSDDCPLHRAIDSRTATWTGGSWSSPGAVSPADMRGEGPRPADERRADAAATAPGAPEAKEPEKKKRGFWSRVFGRGKDDDDKKEKERRDPPRSVD